jgi:hypothetical protein
MAEPLRHRQTKEAATDMFHLKPPRHISTLPNSEVRARNWAVCFTPKNRHRQPALSGPFRAKNRPLREWRPLAQSGPTRPLSKAVVGFCAFSHARSAAMPRSRPARCPRSDRTGVRCRSTAGSWSRERLFFGGCQPERRSGSCLRAGWQAIRCRPGSPPA